MADVTQWMPLHIGAYLRNTQRLNTEQHGAYLLLIIEYWSSQEALPDDDDELALITRLPIDRWKEIRSKIERFFDVSEGVWRHERIESEIKKAEDMVRSKAERMEKARAAKAAKASVTDSITDPVTDDVTASSTETPLPSPLPLPSPKNQEPKNYSLSASPKEKNVSRGTRLTDDWRPPPEYIAFALTEGFSEAEAYREADRFRDYWISKTGQQARKADWLATWRNWCRNSKDKRSGASGPSGGTGGRNGGHADPVRIRNQLIRELAPEDDVSTDGRQLQRAGWR